jgi:hypothetical protein
LNYKFLAAAESPPAAAEPPLTVQSPAYSGNTPTTEAINEATSAATMLTLSIGVGEHVLLRGPATVSITDSEKIYWFVGTRRPGVDLSRPARPVVATVAEVVAAEAATSSRPVVSTAVEKVEVAAMANLPVEPVELTTSSRPVDVAASAAVEAVEAEAAEVAASLPVELTTSSRPVDVAASAAVEAVEAEAAEVAASLPVELATSSQSSRPPKRVMMLTTSKFRSCVVAAGPGPGPVATNAAVGIGKRMPCQPLGPPPAHLLAS